MKFTQLIILILAFLIVKPVQAGLLIEPLVGYSFGSFEGEDLDQEDISGASYGGRLGYQKLGFQLGLDYLKSSFNVDNKDYSSFDTSEIGGFIGFEFPVFLRVYAGYIFSATGETTFDNGSSKNKIEFQSGSGSKFGLGFTGLPFIDINLEYRKGTFDEYKTQGIKVKDATDYSVYMLSLSFPFVL